ncbi:hypothetical protein Btru_011104 [Bulinus truncatus]|nr:hypothetical protein Btru_011104 [Bulinus truncatus]
MSNQISLTEVDTKSYSSMTQEFTTNDNSLTPESTNSHTSLSSLSGPNNVNLESSQQYVHDQYRKPCVKSDGLVSGQSRDGQSGVSQPDCEDRTGYNDSIWTVGSHTNTVGESNGELCRVVVDTECDSSSIGPVSNNAQQKQTKLRKYSWNVDCLLVSIIGVSVVLLAYTVAKLVMGSIYLSECELEPCLPIFLVVDSCVALIYFTMPYFYTRVQNKEKPKLGQWKFPKLLKLGCGITIALILFHTMWLIYGTVIVVETRDTIYSSDHCLNLTTSEPIEHCLTCSESLADFTLIIIAIQWVIIGLVMLMATFFCCCIVCSTCGQKKS